MEKKIYEEPSVKKVEFDFNELIAASTRMLIEDDDMPCQASPAGP